MKQVAVIKFNHKKVNVNDFTIFCIKNTKCNLVDDIKDVVVNGCRYLFVVKAGHGFWDESIFDDCIAEMDIAVKGDENFYCIDLGRTNLEEFKKIKRSGFSFNITSRLFFCHPETDPEAVLRLQNDFDKKVKPFLKPFKDEFIKAYDNLRRGYYVINTETTVDQSLTNEFETLIAVCGGIKTILLLGKHNFNNETKVLMFDVSEAAIEWQLYLRDKWTGDVDQYDDLNKQFHNDHQHFLPINALPLKQWIKTNNISADHIKQCWKRYKSLEVHFLKLDVHKDKEELIKFSNNGDTYFWLSNCFLMHQNVFSKGIKGSVQMQNDWIKDFKKRSSSSCVFDVGFKLI